MGEIVAAALTANDVDDACQIGPLLDQLAGPVASFTGDGAYDQDSVYRAVIDRDPDAAVIVRPRSTAMPSVTAGTAPPLAFQVTQAGRLEPLPASPTQRDRHLERIAEKGRMGCPKAPGYNTRSRVEAAIGRYKQVIGDGLRSRKDGRRATEVGQNARNTRISAVGGQGMNTMPL